MKWLVLFLIISSPLYSAYIDTRDLSVESRQIQRLLGKLDSLKVRAPNNNSTTGTQIAMLSLLTSGLAVAASSSAVVIYDRPYYPPYRPPYRPRPGVYYKPNSVGVAVGSSLAAAGLIGLIASSASEDQQRNQEREISQIQQEINSIISNLVVTDNDFQSEKESIRINALQSTEERINAMDLHLEEQKKEIFGEGISLTENFTDQTNNLSIQLDEFKQNSLQTQQSNILLIKNDTPRTVERELLKMNKALDKEIKKRQKDTHKQIATLTKEYNKKIKAIEKSQDDKIGVAVAQYNTQINKIQQELKDQFVSLFKKYTDAYIVELSAY